MALVLDAPPVPAPPRIAHRRRSDLVPVLAVAGAKTLLQLAVAGRYGWHRDELYYVDAGRHLALGYVDFPPITPLLGRLATAVSGDSLVGLRSLAALAGAAVVVLVALTARELGGGRRAQVLAALVAATSPLLLGTNAMFQTVSFDQLAWAAVLLLAVRALKAPSTGRWLALGVAAGVGLETKYTIALLLVGLAAGLVLTAGGRRHLRTAGPWLAGGTATALLLPNLWWQARHGWPSVDFFTGGDGYEPGETSPGGFVLELLLLVGPAGLALSVPGLRRLARDRRLSPLAVAAAVVVLGFVVSGGKSYYAAPVALVLYAAGAGAAERWARGARWAVPLGALATLVAAGPLILPVADEHDMVSSRLYEQREDYAEQIGWPELAEQVVAAARTLPPDEREAAVVLTGNYGEAGALRRFAGPDLPRVVSGHLSNRSWIGAEDLDARTLVVVGYDRSHLAPHCASVTRAGTVGNAAGVPNEEAGAAIDVCRLRGTLADVWPEVGER